MSRFADNPVIVPDRASAARSAAGRHAKRTNGCAHAAMSGTRSTREASAQPASINGLRLSVFRAADGRRIRSGTRGESAPNRG